jgi:hypothetical protein
MVTAYEAHCVVKYATWPTSGTTITNKGSGGTPYNGTAVDNDYLLQPTGATSFNFNDTTDFVMVPQGGIVTNSPFTLEFVFYLDTLGGSSGDMLLLDPNWGIYIIIGNDGNLLMLKQTPAIDWANFISNYLPAGTFVVGNWYALQITWDTSSYNTTPIIKVDNVSKTVTHNVSGTVASWAAETTRMLFGDGGGNRYIGAGVLFRYHNTILTDAQLIQNYEADKWRYDPNSRRGVIALVTKPFDEAPGAQAGVVEYTLYDTNQLELEFMYDTHESYEGGSG